MISVPGAGESPPLLHPDTALRSTSSPLLGRPHISSPQAALPSSALGPGWGSQKKLCLYCPHSRGSPEEHLSRLSLELQGGQLPREAPLVQGPAPRNQCGSPSKSWGALSEVFLQAFFGRRGNFQAVIQALNGSLYPTSSPVPPCSTPARGRRLPGWVPPV